MRRMARQFWILVTLGLGVSLPAHAFTLYYTADPIEAKVIDADTKQPLEGVVVVAHWELVLSSPGGDSPAGQLMVMEAVTDKNGTFRIPGWGPKLAIRSHLSDYRDPELLLFKSGYEYRGLNNALTGEDRGAHRRSDWDGKTIDMKLFKGTEEEYAEQVYKLDGNFDTIRDGKDCEWKKIPRMLVALDRMREHFDKEGIKVPGWQIGARIRKATDVGNQKKCGSAADYFRIYLP
jgi:hypothetical protein